MTGWFVAVEGVDLNFRRAQFTNKGEAEAHARTWRAMGYDATLGRIPVPGSVRAGAEPVRRFQVIEGGRGKTSDGFAAPAARRNGIA